MELTRQNWRQTWPILQASLQSASLITFDTELTGLYANRQLEANSFDTVQHRYYKSRQAADQLSVTQLGLCTYHFESGKIKARSFTVHVFPSAKCGIDRLDRWLPDRRFVCQSASFDFLAQHQFDFNKWVQQGVSWLTKSEEALVRAKCGSMFEEEPSAREPVVLFHEKDKIFVKETLDKLADWLQNAENVDEAKVDSDSVFNRPYFEIETQSGFQRLILYEAVEKQYNGYIWLEKVKKEGEKNVFLHARRLTQEDKVKMALQREENLRVLNDLVGVRHVVDTMRSVTVPIVAHNWYGQNGRFHYKNSTLDWVHLYHNWIEPLPLRVDLFKQKLVQYFPGGIFDTKFMALQMEDWISRQCKGDSLGPLFEGLSTNELEPVMELDQGFDNYKDHAFHEAGYDAYCTGVIFFKMIMQLAKKNTWLSDSTPERNLDALKTLLESTNHSVWEPWRHRFHWMRTAIPYFDLTRTDLDERPNMYVIIANDTAPEQMSLIRQLTGDKNYQVLWRDWELFKCLFLVFSEPISFQGLKDIFPDTPVLSFEEFCQYEMEATGQILEKALPGALNKKRKRERDDEMNEKEVGPLDYGLP